MMTKSIPVQPMSLARGTMLTNSSKRSSEREFDLFIDKSINRETKVNLKESVRPLNEKGNQKLSNTANDNSVEKSDVSSVNSKIVDKTLKETKKHISKNLPAEVLAMFIQIRNLIMDELELTSEELDTMMVDLELELEDLTDPQAIMQLVLVDSGETDPMAILLDEDLGETFQGLLETMNDIKNDADINLSQEEIRLILEQVKDFNKGEAMIDDQETNAQGPLINHKKSDNELEQAKDSNTRFQLVSEEGDLKNQTLAVSKDDSGLSDTKGSKDGNETDGFEVFLDKLSANYDQSIATFDGKEMRFYEIREIAQQIIDQIRVIINPNQTSMELQLNPEHLGKVNLTVSSKDGLMTAHFIVQNELAKEAVEGQMITLKETLNQQGIRVENIEVTVANYSFDQKGSSNEPNQKMQKKQGTVQKISFEEAVAMGEEPQEDDTRNSNGISGYTIDYTA